MAVKGQMDREEVQWEDIYANSSMSLLLGVLNTSRVKSSFLVQRGIGGFCWLPRTSDNSSGYPGLGKGLSGFTQQLCLGSKRSRKGPGVGGNTHI